MRTQPEIGARLCGHLRSLRSTVPIIRHQHERWNGTGYPDRLKGEAIPLLARVFQIVDIFDALAHERPYKPAWERDRAFQQLERLGSIGVLDGALVEVFCDMERPARDSSGSVSVMSMAPAHQSA